MRRNLLRERRSRTDAGVSSGQGRTTSRCKIVLFGPWPPPYGGVASHVQDLVEQLTGRGFSVRTLGYGDFRSQSRVWRASVSRQSWWRTKLCLRLALSRGTIFHDHSPLLPQAELDLLESLSAIIQARRAQWILTLHDETTIERFHSWPVARQEVFLRFVKQPEHLVSVGNRLETFLRGLGISEGRVSSIPPLLLPLGDGAAAPAAPELQAFLRDHEPVVTTIGAIHPNYDLLTILRAFPIIRARYPRAGLLLIDAGFTMDVEMWGQMQEALGALPPDCCRLCSALPRPQVLGLLAASAVFVRGTRRESFGLSRAEAILLGTPVVTTQTGETRTMELYEFGCPDELASQVLKVLARKRDVSEGQAFFRRIGDQTFDQVLAVYERARDASLPKD